ncbi:hypothetical protein ASG93_32110 [Paenibacillus sp. Soil787]|nr:hypothetical protein ASG93_32110 [Paenibacillus sp. Soil787]
MWVPIALEVDYFSFLCEGLLAVGRCTRSFNVQQLNPLKVSPTHEENYYSTAQNNCESADIFAKIV